MTDRNTHLIGPEIRLVDVFTGEEFSYRQSDPDRVPLDLRIGEEVVVVTDEGALRRGRRRWHPGQVGVVVERSKKHDRGWFVVINTHRVLLFSDEMTRVDTQKAEAA